MTVKPAQRTATEQRTIADDVEDVSTEGRTLRGHAAVFGVLSEDLGGFREQIEPGAFPDVLSDDVRLLVDHAGPPLARTKAGTLRLEQDDHGLAFEADLPETTAAGDLRESVARGDVDGASFRFVIGDEEWSPDGAVRTIRKVARLIEISVAAFPAYPAASIELRSLKTTGGSDRQKGATEMDPQDTGAASATETTETTTETEERTESTEERTERPAAGSLHVEQRASAPRRGLAEEFRAHGFPAETAEIPWEAYEERAVTWSPSISLLSQVDRQGGAFPTSRRPASTPRWDRRARRSTVSLSLGIGVRARRGATVQVTYAKKGLGETSTWIRFGST